MDSSNNALRRMENILHRGVLLPLQEIALRRVAASLWIDVLYSTKMSPFNWKDFEDKVKDNASKVLPLLLKDRMMYIIGPLGSGILSWVMYHKFNFNEVQKDSNLSTLKHLYWTCRGAIDYKKTAKNIIQLEMFSVEMRYKLACLYCLEDDIPILWEKLTKESKKYFRKEIKIGLDMQLECYWAYLLSGEEYKLDIALKKQLPGPLSFNQFVFKLSATSGNKAATEYFFQKLTNEEQDFSLVNAFITVIKKQHKPYWGRLQFTKEDLSVVLCYLLSQMRPEIKLKVLNCYPCNILTCFLDWPLKDLFVEIANVIWTFLPKRKYAQLLTMMNCKPSDYCPESFREFFVQSPSDFRKKFVDLECKFGYFFPNFFDKQDSETVRVIFRNVDAPDSVRLVFGERVFKLLCDFISTDKWHMVEVCLQEAMLSNKDRQRLKKDFWKFMATTDGGVLVKERAHKRKRFCELIGETYMNATGEESSDDETLSRVKKLCSEKKANVLPRI